MESMFVNCENFNQPLNSWDVSNVTNMEAMFANCKNFNQDLSSWDVSNVRYMNAMFYDCKINRKQAFSGEIKSEVNKLTAKDVLDELDEKELVKFFLAYQGFSYGDGEWITDPNNPYIEKMAEYYVTNERKWKNCAGFINRELIDNIQYEFHNSLGTDDIDEAIEKISKPFEEQFEENKIQTTRRR